MMSRTISTVKRPAGYRRSTMSVTAVPGSPLIMDTAPSSAIPSVDTPSISRIWSPGIRPALIPGVFSIGEMMVICSSRMPTKIPTPPNTPAESSLSV